MRTVYKLGEVDCGLDYDSSSPLDYHEIRKKCLQEKTLFTDPLFPCCTESLVGKKNMGRSKVTWARASEISSSSQFSVDGFHRLDPVQGNLGDCWLLNSAAVLTAHPDLFERVVPPDQSFEPDQYCGAFYFRFCEADKWFEVVVDDYLPLLNGKLVFAKSSQENEFWPCLLEKAYAKVQGFYFALAGGNSMEALGHFTGGICEQINLRCTSVPNLYSYMKNALKRKTLFSCGIMPRKDNPKEVHHYETGLDRTHGYSITAVKQVKFKSGEIVSLLRLRNPWGKREWNGAWSDNAEQWLRIHDKVKRKLSVVFNEDGEFWMSFEDFCSNFDLIDVCYIHDEGIFAIDSTDKRWFLRSYHGTWRKGVNAGGSRYFIESFHTNPQYLLTIPVIPNQFSPRSMDTDALLVVSLLQKNRRALKAKAQGDYLVIGCAIYELPPGRSYKLPLNEHHFLHNASFSSGGFSDRTEVTRRYSLLAGTYIIIPSTAEPDFEGDFFLRILCDRPIECHLLDDQVLSKLKHGVQLFESSSSTASEAQDDGSRRDGMCDVNDIIRIISRNCRDELEARELPKYIARDLLYLFDFDKSHELYREEFEQMWSFIRLCRKCFKRSDENSDWVLDATELKIALSLFVGSEISQKLLDESVHCYTDKKGRCCFEDFLDLCTRVERLRRAYRERSPMEDKLSLMEYLTGTL